MRELLADATSERLELAAYQAEFEERFWRTDQIGFWKLERQQFFREPGFDSWEAFARGDWVESLRLLAAGRAEIETEHRRMAEHGFTVRRVRVVEEPIIPYLQWELHVLRERELCGTGVRIIGPEAVRPHETRAALPELCTLGTAVMYEIIYNEHGVLDGARRYSDPELVERCQRFIAELYAAGEPLADYFPRRVAPLPAPAVPQVA